MKSMPHSSFFFPWNAMRLRTLSHVLQFPFFFAEEKHRSFFLLHENYGAPWHILSKQHNQNGCFYAKITRMLGTQFA
jgi:hypothetical protein